MTGPGRPSLCADAAGQRIDLASQALTATGVTLQIVRRNAGGPCQHDRLMHLAQMQADRGEHEAGCASAPPHWNGRRARASPWKDGGTAPVLLTGVPR